MRAALRRMDVRLFLSHALVALSGVVAVAVVVRLAAPGIFDAEMRRRGVGSAMGRAGSDVAAARDSLLGALDVALAIGIVVALAAAALLALVATRKIMGPVDAVRDATRRLAEGTYGVEVPVPAVSELGALAEDVNRLGAALAATEQRRAALVSDLAHELRTPLTTVRGFLEGLTDGVFELTPDLLADLTDEVARLQRLVDDLGVLSRAEEGALPLDLGRHDLARLTGAVVARLGPQFADKGVGLDLVAPDRAFAVVDPDRVTQLLTNVVGNALAYTEPGGRVTVVVGLEGPDVVVEVADTGRGIAADDLARVFDRFHRVERTGIGTGIGLTVARSVARAHRGDVTASSSGPGEGSTFVVRLPVDGPTDGPTAGPAEEPGHGPDAAEGP